MTSANIMNQRTRNVIGNASFFFDKPTKPSSLSSRAVNMKINHHHHHLHRKQPQKQKQPTVVAVVAVAAATTGATSAAGTSLRSPRGLAVSKELSHLLRTWDKGSNAARRNILTRFISDHNSETASEIEASYANGGSLLLSRLISSMRVSRTSLTDIVLHFRAIRVFLASSSGAPYLAEYLDAGGVTVTLNALGSIVSPSNPDMPRAKYLSKTASELCQSAFELLRLVAVAGRPYKELLCESEVLVQISSVMRGSMNSAVNHDGRTLLLELGSGNPQFEESVLYTVLQMLLCSNPVCQRMSAQITRALMSTLSFHSSKGGFDAALSFVPVAVSMTRSVDLQVQYEAVELLAVLSRDCPATIAAIVAGLLPYARNPTLSKEVYEDATRDDDNNPVALIEKEQKQTIKAPENASKAQVREAAKAQRDTERRAEEQAEVQRRNYEQIVAAANSWQASAIRALEALVSTAAGASRAISRQGGVYILAGALLSETNVDARDVSLESLVALCKSEEMVVASIDYDDDLDDVSSSHRHRQRGRRRRRPKNGGATIGTTSQLAISYILGEKQWNKLRALKTTVGQAINDLEGCKQRIRESSGGAAISVDLDAADVKSIVQNLYACRMVTAHLASKAVIRDNAKTSSRRRALSTHMGPETSIEGDDNEYRELMERLIRSSLPEIMDRDFTQSASEALKKRHQKSSRG